MKISRRVSAWRAAAISFVFLAVSPLASFAQQKQLPADAASDPILRALQAELTRSKSQLKMDNVDSPFYIEYRVFDVRAIRRQRGVWRVARPKPDAVAIASSRRASRRLQTR